MEKERVGWCFMYIFIYVNASPTLAKLIVFTHKKTSYRPYAEVEKLLMYESDFLVSCFTVCKLFYI